MNIKVPERIIDIAETSPRKINDSKLINDDFAL